MEILLSFSAAIDALKRKEKLEKELQEIDNSLSKIDMGKTTLENASTNTEVLKGMRVAGKKLKNSHHNT